MGYFSKLTIVQSYKRWRSIVSKQIKVNFIYKIEKETFFSVFLVRGKSERIENNDFEKRSGLNCWETEKEVLLPIT